MKNLIIFLHGKGVPATDERYKVFAKIAQKLNAVIVPIIAPNIHKVAGGGIITAGTMGTSNQ